MRTHDLIQTLAQDLRPVSPRESHHGVLLGLTAGGAVALLLLVAGTLIHLNISRAAHGWPLGMKWLYTAPLCAAGCMAVQALSRPATIFPPAGRLALLSVTGLAMLTLLELSHAPTALWMSLSMGHSWRSCAARIAVLSAPIFAALTWQVRRGAPTRPRLTGAAIGLASGSGAAMLYALGCAETSASFVLIWYSLGIGAPCAVGALIGPKILRW